MASIKKTENGTYRVSWREPTGRQRSKFFKLMREAKAFKASLETDIVQRNYVDPSAGDRVASGCTPRGGWQGGRSSGRPQPGTSR